MGVSVVYSSMIVNGTKDPLLSARFFRSKAERFAYIPLGRQRVLRGSSAVTTATRVRSPDRAAERRHNRDGSRDHNCRGHQGESVGKPRPQRATAHQPTPAATTRRAVPPRNGQNTRPPPCAAK